MMTIPFRSIVKKVLRLYSHYGVKHTQSTHRKKPIKRIAYFLSGGIGDIIMAYPTIELINERWPFAELNIFVSQNKLKLFSTLYNNYCVFSLKSLFLVVFTYGIGKPPFDISFTNTVAVFKLNIELAAFLTSRRSYGFRYREENISDRLYTHSIPFYESKHCIEQNIDLITQQWPGTHTTAVSFHTPRIISKEAMRNQVIIHPGSEKGYEVKRWPIENFKIIISRLYHKGYSVNLLIGSDENRIKRAFRSVAGTQLIINPCPEQVIHMYRKAALFLGNDSGPAHLASFFGVPSVTLFGPVDPVLSSPYGKKNTVVYTSLHCSPCYFSTIHCHDNQCMKSISVPMVWKEIERKLGKNEL